MADIEARLLAQREVDPVTGCWNWTGVVARNGYGRIGIGQGRRDVHRLSLEVFRHVSFVPGECALHRCDNPRCFNPDHLWIGTIADNNADMVAKGRNRNGAYPSPGESNPRAKLSERQVMQVRALIAAGKNNCEIGRQFGVHHSTISLIRHGKRWACCPV